MIVVIIAIVVSVAAGLAAWTVLEYALHRFAMHSRPGRDLISREHLLHHADPAATSLLARSLGHLAVAAVASAGGWGLALLIEPTVAGGLAGGVSLGYSSYELLHWTAHHRAPRTHYGTWLRRRHFQHHFGAPRANFGVTSAVWDKVFATAEPLAPVVVPERLAMAWLVDPDGGAKPEFRADYELRPGRPASRATVAQDRERAFADLPPLN